MNVESKVRKLDVYFGDSFVGVIYDSTPLSFEYVNDWMHSDDRWPIVGIPLQSGVQAHFQVQTFFENLLPEGEQRAYIAAQRKASTLFSLLLAVAGDTSGSLHSNFMESYFKAVA
jgi:serine/threonine-protein kinase HipA